MTFLGVCETCEHATRFESESGERSRVRCWVFGDTTTKRSCSRRCDRAVDGSADTPIENVLNLLFNMSVKG